MKSEAFSLTETIANLMYTFYWNENIKNALKYVLSGKYKKVNETITYWFLKVYLSNICQHEARKPVYVLLHWDEFTFLYTFFIE